MRFHKIQSLLEDTGLRGGKSGEGRWYQFDNRSDLVKRFNAQLSTDLAEEALVAFDFFGDIFKDLARRTGIA